MPVTCSYAACAPVLRRAPNRRDNPTPLYSDYKSDCPNRTAVSGWFPTPAGPGPVVAATEARPPTGPGRRRLRSMRFVGAEDPADDHQRVRAGLRSPSESGTGRRLGARPQARACLDEVAHGAPGPQDARARRARRQRLQQFGLHRPGQPMQARPPPAAPTAQRLWPTRAVRTDPSAHRPVGHSEDARCRQLGHSAVQRRGAPGSWFRCSGARRAGPDATGSGGDGPRSPGRWHPGRGSSGAAWPRR